MRGQRIRASKARKDIPLLQMELKTKHSKTLKSMERTSKSKALLTTIMAEPVERGWHLSSALPSNARRLMERFWRSSISPITETTMFANFSLPTTATSLNAILAQESQWMMRPLVILYILLWILNIGYFLQYYILKKVKASIAIPTHLEPFHQSDEKSNFTEPLKRDLRFRKCDAIWGKSTELEMEDRKRNYIRDENSGMEGITHPKILLKDKDTKVKMKTRALRIL